MEDAFKKLLYAGIGLAATATEKFETTVDELVKKGKVSDTEAKKLIEEFLDKTETKKEDFEDRFQTFVEKLGYTRNSDVEELRKRVEDLEAQLGKSKAASTTKKSTASA